MRGLVKQLIAVVHSWGHPNCRPVPAGQQTVGDVDDLTAVAFATGVLVTPTVDQLIDYVPTGHHPIIEFDCEPIHPANRSWLNDMALAGFMEYCKGEQS